MSPGRGKGWPCIVMEPAYMPTKLESTHASLLQSGSCATHMHHIHRQYCQGWTSRHYWTTIESKLKGLGFEPTACISACLTACPPLPS